MVREINKSELHALLELYTHLHETNIPEMTAHLKHTWDQILQDQNHHIIVNEVDGKLVSSCVCVIIPNLTRGIRPYGFIENVVTHSDYRGKGLASACVSLMLNDCEKRGITVHWDAQNDTSRHLAEKFGYETESVYSVYFLPRKTAD